MIIKTPGKKGTIIEKPVEVGGGVSIRIQGTLYLLTCKVLQINEDEKTVEVKGVDFQGWISQDAIKDCMNPGTYALDNAINVIGNQ
jgi:hypothetical protein